jgi:murein DD-endopeptidase MepM/ murein hydrolase activator NlpD
LFAYAVGALIAGVVVLLILVIREEPQTLSERPMPVPQPAPRRPQPALPREEVLPPEIAARARRQARERAAAAERAQAEAKAAQTAAGSATAAATPTAATSGWSGGAVPDFGELTWPAGTEIVTSEFGPRLDPVDRDRRYVHRGLDVRCGCGTPVLAALTGRVERAGWSERSGNVVRLVHPGGRMTRYAHLSRLDVKAGEHVIAGQQIGLSGATGRVTGPHLHFEIWQSGKPLDPRTLTYFFYPSHQFKVVRVSATACGMSPSSSGPSAWGPAFD